MNASPDPRMQRLATLERYLHDDPSNPHLLADACEEALALGEHERAAAHLRSADALALAEPAWNHRRARLAMARQEWGHALSYLERVLSAVGDQPGVAHDIAYVRLRAGDAESCRSTLAPWLNAASLDPATRDAVQMLWLRASHQLGVLDEARTWASEQAARGDLLPGAAGVASLVALDLGRFEDAASWSSAAFAAGAPPPEALVARASVALAHGDAAAAIADLHAALQRHPADGRTWSALGMANLQARDLVAARSQFARASQLMPGHIGTWHGLGWACLLLQDRLGALAAFQRALQLDEAFAESQGAVGLVLALSGRTEEAEHHLLKAERLDRQNVTSRYARALVSGQLQDASAVRQLAARLLDRPGFFGRRLSENLDRTRARDPSPPSAG